MRIRTCVAGLLAGLMSLAIAAPTRAEVPELRIAMGYPISYLPLMVMDHDKLFQKHAKAAGLGEVPASFRSFAGSNGANDALISGNAEIVVGGVPSFLFLWEKSRTNAKVMGIGGLSRMPSLLNTRNPDIKTIRDFKETDKISMPAAKSSFQAIMLQMECEKIFGVGHHDALDTRMVSLAHPDAMIAMLSGSSEITADFSGAPFQYIELRDPKIHTLLTSYEVIGGPVQFNMMWTTSKFHDENPKSYKAFVDALNEALAAIQSDPERTAGIFLETTKAKDMSAKELSEMLQKPEMRFDLAPVAIMKMADFLSRIGTLKGKPDTWKGYFFPEIHDLAGS